MMIVELKNQNVIKCYQIFWAERWIQYQKYCSFMQLRISLEIRDCQDRRLVRPLLGLGGVDSQAEMESLSWVLRWMLDHQRKRMLLLSSGRRLQLLRMSSTVIGYSGFLQLEMQRLVRNQSLLQREEVSSSQRDWLFLGSVVQSYPLICQERCFLISIQLLICSFWCLSKVMRSLREDFQDQEVFFFFWRLDWMVEIQVVSEVVVVFSFQSLSMRAGLLVFMVVGDYQTREMDFPRCGVDFKGVGWGWG